MCSLLFFKNFCYLFGMLNLCSLLCPNFLYVTYFFSFICFWQTRGSFLQFSPLLPLTEVCQQPRAIPDGNPPGDWQSAVAWGDAGFEPGTAGQHSGTLPLSHHASHEPPSLPIFSIFHIYYFFKIPTVMTQKTKSENKNR